MRPTFVLLCSLAVLAQSTVSGYGAESKAKVVRTKPAPAKTLEGTWKGTFTREGAAAIEYVIKVSATNSVSVVQTNAPAAAVELLPTTAGAAVEGTLENGVLVWQIQLLATAQTPATEVSKSGRLELDADGRHANFSYQVTAKTTDAKAVKSESVSGSGRMSRARE